MTFVETGLDSSILKGVAAAGYTTPTDIQRKAIPSTIAGKDIIACAPTGTGKTAAFVLPIIHQLQKNAPISKNPRVLILTPTRELAQQIEDAVETYGQHTRLRAISLYGGVDISRQMRRLRAGVDIVIATPGRLGDHMKRQSINLHSVETLVLDEADRMLDMGFIQAVRDIIARLPKERQTLLFSATISKEIRSLAGSIQKDPEFIEIGQSFKPVDSVDQKFYCVAQEVKTDLLIEIIQNEEVETMIVFSRTKHGADRIAKKLGQNGIDAVAIHSDRSQSQRSRALEGFKRRQFRILVATDVAARGIDVDKISHVVNYDIPRYSEDYIHRIGRTGRAGQTGVALTFVSNDERKYFKKIEGLTGKRFEVKGYGSNGAEAEKAFSTREPRSAPRGDGRARRPSQKRSFGGGRRWSGGGRPNRQSPRREAV